MCFCSVFEFVFRCVRKVFPPREHRKGFLGATKGSEFWGGMASIVCAKLGTKKKQQKETTRVPKPTFSYAKVKECELASHSNPSLHSVCLCAPVCAACTSSTCAETHLSSAMDALFACDHL